MPYPANDDLPPSVRDHLPPHAQDIYREAFNHAWSRYGGDEATPHRIAWAAVKRSYRKDGDFWVPSEQFAVLSRQPSQARRRRQRAGSDN